MSKSQYRRRCGNVGTGNVRYDGMRVAMRVQCSNVLLLLLLPAARKNIFFDKKHDIFSPIRLRVNDNLMLLLNSVFYGAKRGNFFFIIFLRSLYFRFSNEQPLSIHSSLELVTNYGVRDGGCCTCTSYLEFHGKQ